MSSNKQRLELNWIGKDQRPKLEPRILIEDTEKSYHAPHRVSKSDIYDNKLIFGDNLLALKALEQEYAGKVKCVYIDPPYNTGSAFTHYEDGLEHSLWLSLVRSRLEILRNILSDSGTLWVSIDDNECHYLKILLDEIFGRQNFVGNLIWQKRYSPSNDAIWLSESHDHILLYAKDRAKWRPNKLDRPAETNKAYKNPDNDHRGLWRPDNYKCNKTSDERPNLYYPIIQPNTGEEIWPKRTAVWRYNEETHKKHIEEKLIWWGVNGTNKVPAYKRFLSDVDKGIVPQTIWTWEEVGHNQDAKREQQALVPADPFTTPKPERLIQRILHVASNPGDLILDSFAGSGTTGAVAHKMRRRWIMVELGKHCHTHIIPRMKKVIDGEDQGGISKDVGWKGGGGFRYFNLAPSLLERDRYGNWVINKKYNPAQLTEAVCKHAGFCYEPSDTIYWQHGKSTETDYIYVTTQQLTRGSLEILSDEVGPDCTLMVYCAAFEGKENDFPNLTVKKIPQAIMRKCEWGKDDYSLQVENLPGAPRPDVEQPTLFEQEEEYVPKPAKAAPAKAERTLKPKKTAKKTTTKRGKKK